MVSISYAWITLGSVMERSNAAAKGAVKVAEVGLRRLDVGAIRRQRAEPDEHLAHARRAAL